MDIQSIVTDNNEQEDRNEATSLNVKSKQGKSYTQHFTWGGS